MNLSRSLTLGVVLTGAACGVGIMAGDDADQAAIELIALEAQVKNLRAQEPGATIALDPRIGTPMEFMGPRTAIALQALTGPTGIRALNPSDTVACPPVPETALCGLDRYSFVLAVGLAGVDGDSAQVDVYTYRRLPNPHRPYSRGTRLSPFERSAGAGL